MISASKLKRTDYCGNISVKHIQKEVVVCGFVQKQRDKGNLIFVDLRDRTGIVQLSFNSETSREIFEKAKALKSEYVIIARGIVLRRTSINSDIKTGELEIFPNCLEILSVSKTPPFHILDEVNVKDELKLKYRYLDLRRPDMQKTFKMRHKVTKAVRDYFDENGFLEIETPILIKSTPEGARDYLVPSRVHKGSFFALPQSPQLFKQLIMVAGFDRYMQIAKCFRDEDLRADRQPEFTQIDIEMSFVDQEDIIDLNEKFIKYMFKEILEIDVVVPFRQIPYTQAIQTYGSDKPDTRFSLELSNLSNLLVDTEFNVFSNAISVGGSVRGILAKNLSSKLTRKEIDKLSEFVKTYKAKGLAYTRITDDGSTSSYEKFLSESEIAAIRDELGACCGDVIFIIADPDDNVVFDSLGNLRLEIAKKFGLIDKTVFDLLWVTDFPLFEYDQDAKRYVSKHHPFTCVNDEDLDLLETDPSKCRSKAYDLVLNGSEMGGGSIRISDQVLQQKIFSILGFSESEYKERFGFLLDAFEYGVPPHGGIAYGLDRLVMSFLGKESIKDVIAFPKVQNSSDLMVECPSPVDRDQLDELNIKLNDTIN